MKLTLTASKIMIALSAIAIGLSGGAAIAAGPSNDYFNRNTTPYHSAPAPAAKAVTPALPSFTSKSPAQLWFDGFDQQVFGHAASADEKYTLAQNFGNPPQFERVVQWSNTASGLAKKYRDLAQILRSMPLSPSMANDPQSADLDKYKEHLAQWYDDSATWLEDYIKPRPAARTIEELNGQLNAMHTRSEQLKESMAHLQEMDSGLRSRYNVLPPRYDNKILNYASRLPQSTTLHK